jgi:hypothetical protein
MQQFSLDRLTETEFEEFCYDLLCELGCSNISWRKGTGPVVERLKTQVCQALDEGNNRLHSRRFLFY